MKTNILIILVATMTLAHSVRAAENPEYRHGAVPEMSKSIQTESGFTTTYQRANDSRASDEILFSFDLVSTIPSGSGQWLIYVEGNTSPKMNGVSSLIGEANGDAGSALDRDGKGRLQVSELHYLRNLGKDAIVAGLIDPAGSLDNSDIANDETGQFLSGSLVNNPTIAFPDYTLGLIYFFKPAHANLDLTFLISNSHGLADNPNASYSELVDVGDNGKGVFAIAEAHYRTGAHNIRVGAWVQTADNEYLDGSGNTGNNYGLYTSSDFRFGAHLLNVRVGLANEKVSEAMGFVGFAVEHPLGKNNAGIGLTRTFVSKYAGGATDDITQFEVYYRHYVAEHFSLTPSVQKVKNSGFDNSGNNIDSDINVYSVRATYTF